jgi:hypothetical protein
MFFDVNGAASQGTVPQLQSGHISRRREFSDFVNVSVILHPSESFEIFIL